MIDDAALAVLTDEELAKHPFDELVAALQRSVQALEAGSVGLEESIELYKRALRLHAGLRDAAPGRRAPDHRARSARGDGGRAGGRVNGGPIRP